MDESAIVLLVGLLLLSVGAVLIGGLLGIAAFVRTQRQEARIRALEARIAQGPVAPPVGAAPPVTAAPPVATASPETAAPAAPTPPPITPPIAPPTPPAGPLPLPPLPKPAPGAPHDLETQIAGRWLNRIGLTAVAVGVSYFLKYAIDNDWIGPSGQVALGILLGVALLASAPALIRRGYVYFADGLTGLGAAILYLSIWAGGSYYQLFSPTVAFVGMIAVTAAILAIAIGRNAQRIAILALLGGFLTPILVSTGRDADRELFVYLAVLDVALLVIVASRAWRLIEWPAFLFTQLYFWVTLFEPATARADTLVYASAFFLIFAALPMLAARRLPQLHIEHACLVIVNAAVCLLAFHGVLWPNDRWALTAATILIAAAHLVVAQAVPAVTAGVAQARLIFAGVALSLLTVAIPMRLDGRWLTFAWAVEAAVLVVTSFRARVLQMRVLGYVLFALVVARLAVQWPAAGQFLFNARAATIAATIASMAVALWQARAHRDQWRPAEPFLFGLMSVTINVLALVGLTAEVSLYFRPADFYATGYSPVPLAEGLSISVLWILYATGLVIVGARKQVAALRWQGLALFGITTMKVFFGDLAELSGFYRIASSVALGVVLLIVSFLYQRKATSDKAEAA